MKALRVELTTTERVQYKRPTYQNEQFDGLSMNFLFETSFHISYKNVVEYLTVKHTN